MTTIGAAIIGCGAIHPLHAQALASHPQAELRLVMDTMRERAEKAASSCNCDWTTNLQDVWAREDIQVIHLCTPHHTHVPLALEALQAGKHVLIEKPVAMRPSEARQLAEAVDQSGLAAGVVFQNRYNASSQQIKSMIASGELGALRCLKGIVTWHRSALYYTGSGWRGSWAGEGGGVLINQAIHTLDLLQWFGGGQAASVKGMVSADSLASTIETEDSVHAALTFADGVRALFYATNSYLADRPVELELVFEHGVLLQRNDSLYVQKGREETLLVEPPVHGGGGKSYWGSSHRLLIHDFYDCLLEGRAFPVGVREGTAALDLIYAIYASSARGQHYAPGDRLPPALEEERPFYGGMIHE